MRRIKLTQGYFALVDDEDYGYLVQHRWHMAARKRGNNQYAMRYKKVGELSLNERQEKKRSSIAMQNEIMNPPDGFVVDHIDGNGLDNRRSNLRLSTSKQNCMNASLSFNNKSGYKGVCREVDEYRSKPWGAFVQINGRRKRLGRFATPEEAARAYDEAAIEHYGEFARTNKSMGLFKEKSSNSMELDDQLTMF